MCGSAVTQRILHGRAGIRNFSSSVEEHFTSECSEQVNFFQHEKRNFVCNILFII